MAKHLKKRRRGLPDQESGSGRGALPEPPREVGEDDILALFAPAGGQAGRNGRKARPLSLDAIFQAFSRNKKARKRQLERLLASLTAQGKLIRLKGPAYVPPASLPQARGRIRLQRQGQGFVAAGDGREIYIHPAHLGGAWNNDLVLVGLLPGQSGKNPEGRVLEVLERSVQKLAVLLLPQLVREEAGPDRPGGRSAAPPPIWRLARPLDARLGGYLLVDTSGLVGRDANSRSAPGPGDAVLAELLPQAEQRHDGVSRARALSSLGGAVDDSVPLFETLVKAEQNIATAFPQAALDECAALPADPDADAVLAPADKTPGRAGRRDLRQLEFVTMDGADARDFDDAIQVEGLEDGSFLLRVAIADVAHYVRPGSALDAEAAARGNSCYFPASVEPMLPAPLSNGLCSLMPHRPRLVLTAEIEFDPGGRPGKTAFYPGLIQSRARLTYEETQAALDYAAAPPHRCPPDWADAQSGGREPLLPMLLLAEKLARLLLAGRLERGALCFELPEPEIEVNRRNGRVEGLRPRRRLFAHQMIEEFMIAANEAVARHLAAASIPFLYRSHPAPDPEKLLELAKVLERNGLATAAPRGKAGRRAGADGPPDLRAILERARGGPEEFVVNRLLLRSLMQARYTPKPDGHFGLASGAYCHFTSPIRRYADLTVHRALRRSFGLPERTPAAEDLARIGESLNEAERRAVEAERDIHKICAALYLRQLDEREPGRVFPAVVASLSSFGLFVELLEMPAEGFVPAEALADDFYRLDAESQMLVGLRHGHIYRLGQPLAVLLDQADPLRREIRFRPAPASPARSTNPARSTRPARSGSPGTPGARRGAAKKPARQPLPKGSVRSRRKQDEPDR